MRQVSVLGSSSISLGSRSSGDGSYGYSGVSGCRASGMYDAILLQMSVLLYLGGTAHQSSQKFRARLALSAHLPIQDLGMHNEGRQMGSGAYCQAASVPLIQKLKTNISRK